MSAFGLKLMCELRAPAPWSTRRSRPRPPAWSSSRSRTTHRRPVPVRRVRHEMLEEAIDMIRTLWTGDWTAIVPVGDDLEVLLEFWEREVRPHVV